MSSIGYICNRIDAQHIYLHISITYTAVDNDQIVKEY